MLYKIRSDILKSFRRANYLWVNTKIFSTFYNEQTIFKNIWKLNFDNILLDLNNLGKKIIFYNYKESECTLIEHKYNIIKQNGHIIVAGNGLEEDKYSIQKSVIIAYDLSDEKLMKKSLFSIIPSSSDLDTKMISSYVSNFDNEAVFIEVGNLIYNSSI